MNLIDPKQIRGFEERLSLISSEYTQLDNDFLKSSGGLLSGQLIVSGELNYNILNISGYNNKLNLWNQSDSGNLTLNNPLNTAIDCFINIGSNNNYDANFNIININNKNIQIGLDNTANLLISGTDFVKINLYDENYMNFSNSGTKIYSKISTDYKNIIDDGFYYLENISGKIDEINLDEYVMANYLVIANSDSFNKKYSYFSKYDISWTNSFTYYGDYGSGISINRYNFDNSISSNPLDIKFKKNQYNNSLLDIYIENKTFQNWRIYFISEKIKLEDVFSSSSSSKSSSSSSKSSSSSSKSSSSKSSLSSSSSKSSSSSSSHSSSSSSISSDSSSSSSSWMLDVLVATGFVNVNGTYNYSGLDLGTNQYFWTRGDGAVILGIFTYPQYWYITDNAGTDYLSNNILPTGCIWEAIGDQTSTGCIWLD